MRKKPETENLLQKLHQNKLGFGSHCDPIFAFLAAWFDWILISAYIRESVEQVCFRKFPQKVSIESWNPILKSAAWLHWCGFEAATEQLWQLFHGVSYPDFDPKSFVRYPPRLMFWFLSFPFVVGSCFLVSWSLLLFGHAVSVHE